MTTASFPVYRSPAVRGGGDGATSPDPDRGSPDRADFLILGPLEVVVDHRSVPLRAPKQRSLLACLLLHAGQTVGVEKLLGHLWEGNPPASGRNALHVHMNRLRQTLERAGGERLIHTVPEGYRISIAASALDLNRFDDLVERAERARQADRPREEADLLAAALALWRGPALDDVPAEALQREAVPVLTERRLRAAERYFDVGLFLGRQDRILAPLREMTAEHPYRERFWYQLILTLYRCDRQAEALAAYAEVRDRLNEELGIDPGERLVRLQRAILSGAPALPAESAAKHRTAPADTRGSWTSLYQLPRDERDFVGREAVLGCIVEAATPHHGLPASPVVVLSGGPGAGKTATALRAAHRLRGQFPDGQWYVRLSGTDDSPRDPAEVLAELLSACGSCRVPPGLEARAAALRAQLADRRVLLLLDDVTRAEQVTLLLPGTAGSTVLVTSRVELPELSASCGARLFALSDELTESESAALLEGVLGRARLAAEPEAAAELARLCDRLPLALRIAAATLAADPRCRVADYVARLREGDPLSRLTLGHGPRAGVRDAFRAAAALLSPQAARVYRLLPLTPGPDFGTATVRVLAGLADDGRAQEILDRLAAGHLVAPSGPGRFRLRGLTRAYATELSRTADAPDERTRAARRMNEWLFAGVREAVRRLGLGTFPELPGSGDAPARFAEARAASAWLDAERATLVALVEAGDTECPAIELAALLGPYLTDGGHHEQALRCALAARAAEQRAGRGWSAATLIGLGFAHLGLGRSTRARLYFTRALERDIATSEPWQRLAALRGLGLAIGVERHGARAVEVLTTARDLADRLGGLRAAACVRRDLAAELHRAGRLDEAREELLVALRDARLVEPGESGPGIARTLWRLGLVSHDQGRAERAVSYLAQALASGGTAHDQAAIEAVLARTYLERGGLGTAARHGGEALRLACAGGDARCRAHALNVLGEIARAQGQRDLAFRHHTVALRLARRVGSTRGECEARTGLVLVLLAERDARLLRPARWHARAAVGTAVRAGHPLIYARACHTLHAVSTASSATGATRPRRAETVSRACVFVVQADRTEPAPPRRLPAPPAFRQQEASAPALIGPGRTRRTCRDATRRETGEREALEDSA
ncbi:AfsR/SARP family transcriptional regulator [Embleya scabrispora]|uniref:AfsR/SARP family transcriptional regulator n=1 Tax=Embleya scabrispora TaxID=159449 RepID=UPI00117C6AC9|nr:BTAD domain-containing putative transcriptional regulator [Embleya scabrispora]